MRQRKDFNTEVTKNHREIYLTHSVVYSTPSQASAQCSLWLFSVCFVLNSEDCKMPRRDLPEQLVSSVAQPGSQQRTHNNITDEVHSKNHTRNSDAHGQDE